MPGAGLPVAYVQKIQAVQAVIQGNVRIKTGVRTENVHWKRESGIVMYVTKTAGKVSHRRHHGSGKDKHMPDTENEIAG